MSTDSLTLSEYFPVAPASLLARWLDPAWHARFTGGATAVIDALEGGEYSAWDGYIEGTTLTIAPDRIVQTWRTAEFDADDPPSRLDLHFAAEGAGTRLTLQHDGIPVGQGDMYREGWEDHYFVHMRDVLGG